jgi:hypothetical protein
LEKQGFRIESAPMEGGTKTRSPARTPRINTRPNRATLNSMRIPP